MPPKAGRPDGVIELTSQSATTALTEVCLEVALRVLYQPDTALTRDTLEDGLRSGLAVHKQLQQSGGAAVPHRQFSEAVAAHERYRTHFHVISEVTDSTAPARLTPLLTGGKALLSQMLDAASYQSSIALLFNSNLFASCVLVLLWRGRLVLFDPTPRSHQIAQKRVTPPPTPLSGPPATVAAAAAAAAKSPPVAASAATPAAPSGAAFLAFHGVAELHTHLAQLYPFTAQAGDAALDNQLNSCVLTFFQLQSGVGMIKPLAPPATPTPAHASAAAASPAPTPASALAPSPSGASGPHMDHKHVPGANTTAVASASASASASPAPTGGAGASGAAPALTVNVSKSGSGPQSHTPTATGGAPTPVLHPNGGKPPMHSHSGSVVGGVPPAGGGDSPRHADASTPLPKVLVRHPSAERLTQSPTERLSDELLLKQELRRYVLQLEQTVREQHATIDRLQKQLAVATAAAAAPAAHGTASPAPGMFVSPNASPPSSLPRVSSQSSLPDGAPFVANLTAAAVDNFFAASPAPSPSARAAAAGAATATHVQAPLSNQSSGSNGTTVVVTAPPSNGSAAATAAAALAVSPSSKGVASSAAGGAMISPEVLSPVTPASDATSGPTSPAPPTPREI